MANVRRMAGGAAGLVLALCGTAACESDRNYYRGMFGGSGWDAQKAAESVPDALDYLGNVQCAALALAEGDLGDRYSRETAYQQWGVFQAWAEARAREAGQDPKAASGAIDAMADDLLAGLRKGGNAQKLEQLRADYAGDVNVCASAISNFGFRIVIGG